MSAPAEHKKSDQTTGGMEAALLGKLIDAWYMRSNVIDGVAPILCGDQLLLADDFDGAIAAYAGGDDSDTALTRTRIGIAATLKGGQMEFALSMLDMGICLQSAAGKALFASTSYAAGIETSYLNGPSDEIVRLSHEAALCDVPSPYAIRRYWTIAYRDPWDVKLRVAEIGIRTSNESYLYARRANALSILDRNSEIDLRQLAKLAECDEECAESLLDLTFEDGPWDLSIEAIQLLGRYRKHDKGWPDSAALALAVIDIRRAIKTSDASLATKALLFACEYGDHDDHEALPHIKWRQENVRLVCSAIRIAAGLVLHRSDVVLQGADQAAEIFLRSNFEPQGMLIVQLASLTEQWDTTEVVLAPAVAAIVPLSSQWHWMNVIVAYHEGRKPDWTSVQAVVRQGRFLDLPDWAQQYVASTQLATGHAKPRILGNALARWACYAGTDGEFEIPGRALKQTGRPLLGWVSAALEQLNTVSLTSAAGTKCSSLLSSTSLAQKLSTEGVEGKLLMVTLAKVVDSLCGDLTSMFNLGYAQFQASHFKESAESFLAIIENDPENRAAMRNLALCYLRLNRRDDLAEIQNIARGRTGPDTDQWSALAIEIDEWLNPKPVPESQSEALFRDARKLLDDIRSLAGTAVVAEDLSLGEATALVALIRGADINHATWTLSPLASSDVPFDPTGRFLGILRNLALRGVLQIESVPQGKIHRVGDGVEFNWDYVRFRITPETLALYRSILELQAERWPAAWTKELETLAISVAVEECIAYIRHEADKRDLPLPAEADLRGAFRSHLQHVSAGKCWYFAYKAIQAANDMRSMYPAGQIQLAARVLNTLRQFGELAIERGYDTCYGRIKALPRSHFVAALYDGITRWGEREVNTAVKDLIP